MEREHTIKTISVSNVYTEQTNKHEPAERQQQNEEQ